MSAGTIISRILGFGRTFAMAYALGVSLAGTGAIPIASAFNISNNIPNMIYELVAGGILSSMFVPIFLEKYHHEGEGGAFRLANTLFSLFLVVLGVVALFGTVFPQPFVWTQTFTKTAAETELAVYLFRFFAVQIIFYAFIALSTGMLNSQRRFFASALAPAFNSIVVIVVLLGVYVPLRTTHPHWAIISLGVGTTLGVVALFVAQVPALLRMGFRWQWSWDLTDPYLRKMLKKGTWLLVYVGVNMVQISFRNSFATATMPDGSAALSYAWMWYQLPYGVLAVSYITAIFTELSETANRRDWEGFKRYFTGGLRAMSLLMLPCAALLIVLSTPIVSLLAHGQFHASAVPLVVSLLISWSLGLFFYATSILVLRAFYAMQDTRTPALVNAVLTVVQVALYWFLPRLIGGRFALAGVPLADSVFFALLLMTMLVILRRRIGGFDFARVLRGWFGSLVSAVAAGAVAWCVLLLMAPLDSGLLMNLARDVAGGVAGLAAAYGMMKALRIDEVNVVDALLRRVARTLPGAA